MNFGNFAHNLSRGSSQTMIHGSGGCKTQINGVTYTGRTITVTNGRVIVDGNEVASLSKEPAINIVITGNVQDVSSDIGNIEIKGNVASAHTVSGAIRIDGDVSGGAKSVSGDITINGDVGGSAASVSGDVRHSKCTREHVSKKQKRNEDDK